MYITEEVVVLDKQQSLLQNAQLVLLPKEANIVEAENKEMYVEDFVVSNSGNVTDSYSPAVARDYMQIA